MGTIVTLVPTREHGNQNREAREVRADVLYYSTWVRNAGELGWFVKVLTLSNHGFHAGE